LSAFGFILRALLLLAVLLLLLVWSGAVGVVELLLGLGLAIFGAQVWSSWRPPADRRARARQHAGCNRREGNGGI
jgi:fatty acid desaturase